MKRKTAAVLLLLCLAGVGTGTVCAYLTAHSSVQNQVTTASADIEISEIFDPPEKLTPGTHIPKTVTVTSHSAADCYVRVMVKFSSLEAEQFCAPLQIQQGWEAGKDGYYYWMEPVKPGEETGALFTEVSIRDAVQEEQLEAFDLLVYAEAVCCGNRESKQAWENLNPAVE